MKPISIFIFITVVFVGLVNAEGIYFTTTPTISPDAKKVVFSYEGDLWTVNADGGTAYRLTGMQGQEKDPRFSPDGQWIAFSGTQDGNSNVYVMPVNEGKIKQLTLHDSHDRVDSWSWDSNTIYFNSDRYNSFTAFKVSINGGTPERLFEHYFNTIHGVAEHPISNDYYFTDTWESLLFANRKRYKGAYNPDIKSYNPKTKTFKVHTTYRGKDFQPTIDKQGNLYFISDRDNGETNLFALENGEKIRLTQFKRSIKTPQVSANGKKIVFEKDYQLFIYDTQTRETGKITIHLSRSDVLKKEQDFNINGKITHFDVSPDGKKIAFASRGELFVSDIKGKFVRQLQTSPQGRVKEIKWLKDNKTILFNQTVNGWYNLFKISADKNEQETQLTSDRANNRGIALNSNRTLVVYLSGSQYVKSMDLNTFKSQTLVKEEIWGLYSNQPYFSPGDEYVAFTAYRNFERDIFLHHLQTGKTVNLTDSGISERTPSWSPDGKYLFFASNRVQPMFPRSRAQTKIYRLPLEKYRRHFRSVEFDKLFIEKDKNTKNKSKEKKVTISIDFQDMIKRWEQVSPDPGTQWQPYVIIKENGDAPPTYHVLYLSNHDGGKPNVWQTTLEPFEPAKTKKIKGAADRNLMISKGKDNYYLLVQGKIGKLDLKANQFKPIEMKYTFRRDLESEFKQMFFEMWASLSENFYDENFHGVDWNKVRKQYAEFLPHIASRSHLRTLISDMLGELNSSHLGFNSRGDEEKTFHRVKTMQTGVIFEKQAPYTVKSIVTGSPVDKKGIDIKPGDVLTAVNNREVDPRLNREHYFTAPSMDDELELTFKRESENKTFTVKVHPVDTRGLKRLLYDEWVRRNQQLVDQKSSRRIAYIHMKSMGRRALDDFLIEMTTESYKREGLILDLRYNTGGNVHDAVLNFLSQRPYTLWKYRGGEFAPQPNFAPSAKPIVLLINERSLSDAEMTAAGFKELKLGKIIGTETYRWLIFTSGKRLVDGSYYRLPSWGCYTLDKKNLEKHGAAPDIYIKNTFKDRLEGKDPQLEAAVNHILKQLK